MTGVDTGGLSVLYCDCRPLRLPGSPARQPPPPRSPPGLSFCSPYPPSLAGGRSPARQRSGCPVSSARVSSRRIRSEGRRPVSLARAANLARSASVTRKEITSVSCSHSILTPPGKEKSRLAWRLLPLVFTVNFGKIILIHCLLTGVTRYAILPSDSWQNQIANCQGGDRRTEKVIPPVSRPVLPAPGGAL